MQHALERRETLEEKLEAKKPLGIYRHRWEDNIIRSSKKN
jgi:hypothetical protein